MFPSSGSCATGTTGTASDGTAYTTSGAAGADLRSGGLIADASSSGSDEAQADAGATLFDVLNFSGNTAGGTGNILITASGTLNGTGGASIFFQLSALSPGFATGAGAGTGLIGSNCFTVFLGGRPFPTCASSDGTNLSLSAAMPVDVGAIALSVNLGAGATGTGAANYSDPIKITLPPGVTFTSESGLFLTAASAVPEPSSLLLLSTGLAGVLGAMRRRLKATK